MIRNEIKKIKCNLILLKKELINLWTKKMAFLSAPLEMGSSWYPRGCWYHHSGPGTLPNAKIPWCFGTSPNKLNTGAMLFCKTSIAC
jgi:hypothetical protein